MTKTLIEVKNLTKQFHHSTPTKDIQYALKQVNLKVYEGDIYGLIGMSGAGKSTLMRCLTGLEQPTEGSILIDGQEIWTKGKERLTEIRQQMGMVFQHFCLFSSRTVASNIAYPLEIQKMAKAQQKERVSELLSLVGLEDKKDKYPSQLSGGEKQRVGIARALANHPRLLLCDEPTSALDPKTSRSILQLLLKLNQTIGVTIIMITHQLEAVKQICQRVGVLAKGELVEEGLARQIFTQPQHPLTRHLLHFNVDQLPSNLLNTRDASKKLIRLAFEGQQAQQPIISHLVKQHDVEANILFGGLDYLHQTLIGNLIIELSGQAEELDKALSFLHSRNIYFEVIL